VTATDKLASNPEHIIVTHAAPEGVHAMQNDSDVSNVVRAARSNAV
jgi:hypothetical protein